MLLTQINDESVVTLEGEPDNEEMAVWKFMAEEEVGHRDDRRSDNSHAFNTGSPTNREEREMQARLEAPGAVPSGLRP